MPELPYILVYLQALQSRIVYAENETNYCACCQTGGRLLADRALSRLLKQDWPRTLEELEGRRFHERRPHLRLQTR